MPRVLVACEESQAVTIEMRKLGIEAWSCDVEPCSGGHPEWHLQQDVTPLLAEPWDMIIAFPPCTHLCVSGAAWFEEKRKDGRQQSAINFFMKFADAPSPRIAVENPVGIMSGYWRRPNQIIQPWQFGHPFTKQTCLWLKGLPRLKPTQILTKPKTGWENQQFTKDGKYGGYGGKWGCKKDGKWLRYSDPDVARERSKTFPGIAKAMADQWGRLLIDDDYHAASVQRLHNEQQQLALAF